MSLVTHEWLLVTTSIPYGNSTKGHLVIEGVGLDSDYSDCHRTQIAWGFEEKKLVTAKAVVTASNYVSQPISIVDNNGKTAFKIPGGKGAHAIVSYVWTADGYEDIKGWTVKPFGASGPAARFSFSETEIDVIQTYSNINEEMPVGAPIPWISETIPKGFLPYTGISFDTGIFPKLANLYPSGILLDLTGDVLRAAEVGRVILTHQGQSVQPLGFESDPHTHDYSRMRVNNVSDHSTGRGHWLQANSTYKTLPTTVTGKITGTGDETRMANTSVLYITKAG